MNAPTARRIDDAPLRRPARVLLGLWTSAVVVITLWPTHVDEDLAPLLQRALRALHERGLPTRVTYASVEVAANVAMLVPLGILVLLAFGRHHLLACLVAGPLLSISVELVQSTMPGRTASILDVVANSVGACLGVAIGAGLDVLSARRARHRAANPAGRRSRP